MKFKVNDMTCGGCARHIQDALKKEDVTANVMINLNDKTVEITSSLTPEKISEIIREEGYSPVLVTN